MSITAEEILAEIGPVQEVLDEHDGVVNVIDTSDGNIMLSLDGGCTGCSSTPMTAMQIYYALKQLDTVEDVVFVNGELPEYMRAFIDQRMALWIWRMAIDAVARTCEIYPFLGAELSHPPARPLGIVLTKPLVRILCARQQLPETEGHQWHKKGDVGSTEHGGLMVSLQS